MGMYLRQENTRTKLQEQIAADLAEKAKKKAAAGDTERPDGVDDSAYLQRTKSTTSLAWVWALIILGFIALVVWLAVATF